jgi:nitrogen fixation NifU-like protein
MYVCLCKAITTEDLEAAVRKGHKTLPSIQKCTGAGSGCGRCREFTQSLLEDLSKAQG